MFLAKNNNVEIIILIVTINSIAAAYWAYESDKDQVKNN